MQITATAAQDVEGLVNYLRRRGAGAFDDALVTGKQSDGTWAARWYFATQEEAVAVFNITAEALGRTPVDVS